MKTIVIVTLDEIPNLGEFNKTRKIARLAGGTYCPRIGTARVDTLRTSGHGFAFCDRETAQCFIASMQDAAKELTS